MTAFLNCLLSTSTTSRRPINPSSLRLEVVLPTPQMHPQCFLWRAGFFRVLHLIWTFPWSAIALVVDTDDEISANDIRSIQAWHSEQRVTDPDMYSMAICTPFDRQSSLTKAHPDTSVLARLRYLAGDSVASSLKPLSFLFSETDWTAFDVVLHLRREALAHPERALADEKSFGQASVLNRDPVSSTVLSHIPVALIQQHGRKHLAQQLLVGFDPLQCLWESLTSAFGDVAVFCCDRQGGCRIGVHWKPSAFKTIDEDDVTHHTCRNRIDGCCVVDTTAILSEISTLGKGIVENIEIT